MFSSIISTPKYLNVCGVAAMFLGCHLGLQVARTRRVARHHMDAQVLLNRLVLLIGSMAGFLPFHILIDGLLVRAKLLVHDGLYKM